jgi:exosortase K
MNNRSPWIRYAQLGIVLLLAAALKWYYSTATVNQLRWILAPTKVLVEWISGMRFEFESHAGYMSSDRGLLIAASCAGVNFLITSFLLLSLRKLWRARAQKLAWRFIPATAMFAYLSTIVANTIRITVALQLKQTAIEISWLTPTQLHRLEGILIYFGFLVLLFITSEKVNLKHYSVVRKNFGNALEVETTWNSPNEKRSTWGLLRLFIFPLVIYYTTTLGIPLANGAYRNETGFGQHALFVLAAPLVALLLIALFALAAVTSMRFAWMPRVGSARYRSAIHREGLRRVLKTR